MKRTTLQTFWMAALFCGMVFALCPSCMSGSTSASGESDAASAASSSDSAYAVVDTDQSACYDVDGFEIDCPAYGSSLYGQDAQVDGAQPGYTDNGDGTVTDDVTGLMWQQDPGDKMTYDEAVLGADTFELAGYDDWRLPTVKELYSLIIFSGTDPSGGDESSLIPFIDDDYFFFEYGDEDAGERTIDSQWATSSVYGSTVMDGQECFFGVNFADGRIKCYPTSTGKGYFVIYVRDVAGYGTNDFLDNGDGTITDFATGLVWMREDSGALGAGDEEDGALDWEQALSFCEDLDYADSTQWRLPNAKELQSIVDYDRSLDITSSPAIDSLFETTAITNEAGEIDYPFFWTSTTHVKSTGVGDFGAYVGFGRCLGYMNGAWMDVHGAGCQRSDPKSGDSDDYPFGFGPQGDARRIYNYVRCVRDAE